MGEDFAYAEGEGDRTLEDWRKGHRIFWGKMEDKDGEVLGDGMGRRIVCERFEVVYPVPGRSKELVADQSIVLALQR